MGGNHSRFGLTLKRMQSPASLLEHERVTLRRGTRSGLCCIAAVHSTVRGSACGGVRLWQYPSFRAALEDALRLSRAMTYKNAAARLAHGGGKAVIALAAGESLEGERRRAALLDFGDLVESFGGSFQTAGDVGTSADDMVTVRERTEHAHGLPESHGGGGDTGVATAAGLELALEETCLALYGDERLGQRSFAVIGLGKVGAGIARRLAAHGAKLTVTDIDPARRGLAEELGASWVDPADAVSADVDVLAPCGLGGLLTPETVARLRCDGIAGAANNQLADESVAELLQRQDILWAPDFIANAGGAIQAQLVDVDGGSAADVAAHLPVIRENLRVIFRQARERGTTPLAEANRVAEQLIVPPADATS